TRAGSRLRLSVVLAALHDRLLGISRAAAQARPLVPGRTLLVLVLGRAQRRDRAHVALRAELLGRAAPHFAVRDLEILGPRAHVIGPRGQAELLESAERAPTDLVDAAAPQLRQKRLHRTQLMMHDQRRRSRLLLLPEAGGHVRAQLLV